MSTPSTVTLRGGLQTPVEALRLALDLEARGVTLTVDEAGRLLASPPSRLTAADYPAIRTHKTALVRLVHYAARGGSPGPAGAAEAFGAAEQRTTEQAT